MWLQLQHKSIKCLKKTCLSLSVSYSVLKLDNQEISMITCQIIAYIHRAQFIGLGLSVVQYKHSAQ